MGQARSRYKQMERWMTRGLLADAADFAVYLLAAGLGIGWLKILTVIVAVTVSGLCLTLLNFSGELRRRRSRWMSVGFAAVLICLLASLVLRYPSPNPLKDTGSGSPNGAAVGAYCIPPSGQ